MNIPNQVKSCNFDAELRIETQAINNGYAIMSCTCISIHVTTTTEAFPNAQVRIEKSTTSLELRYFLL